VIFLTSPATRVRVRSYIRIIPPFHGRVTYHF
jgi:hypothetical protein